ncbi:phosphatase PAP2 family protein [Carnobacterium maltaromaticum]|nr:hypothetical protein IV75_GL002293 [Carnobacterium maltaromaticum]
MTLLLICTFYDLEISKALFNTSSHFGQFFEAIGELPMTYIGCFSAAALVVTTKKRTNWSFYVGKIGFSSLMLLFSFFSVMMSGMHISIPLWLKLVLTLVTCLFFYLLARAVPTSQHMNLRKAAKVGLLLAISAIFLITILKMLWGRMRFREMTDPANQFTRWYLPQSLTTNNEFMSFPSGHAANATVVLWISLLPTFVKSLVGKKRLLEVTAIVWIGLVMISRIVMGAHFATDVIVGMLISMMLFFFLKYKFMPQNSENTMLL